MKLKAVFMLAAALRAISMNGGAATVKSAPAGPGTSSSSVQMTRQESVRGTAPGGDACAGPLGEAQARIQALEAEVQTLRASTQGTANANAELTACQRGTEALNTQLRECNEKFGPLQQRVDAQSKDIERLIAMQKSAEKCTQEKGTLESTVAQLQQQVASCSKGPASVRGSAEQSSGGPFPDLDSCITAYMQLKASASSSSIQQEMGHVVIGSSNPFAKTKNNKKLRI
mgnify:CR=1 FL=1